MKKIGWTYEFNNLISPEKISQLKRYFHIMNVLHPETIELALKKFLMHSSLEEMVLWFKAKSTYSLIITKKDILLKNLTENGKILMVLERTGFNVKFREEPTGEVSAVLRKILYETI